MRDYKMMNINFENKEGYYKIFNILKEKIGNIFYKYGISMIIIFILLFALPTPTSIFMSTLAAVQVPFFTLMYLVFMKKGFITRICKKDIDEVKKQFPDLEFDTDICFNELEANLRLYNEKNDEIIDNADIEELYVEEEIEKTNEKKYDYEAMPNYEDVKIKVLGIKKK